MENEVGGEDYKANKHKDEDEALVDFLINHLVDEYHFISNQPMWISLSKDKFKDLVVRALKVV